jgi:hypothetical protein
MIKPKEKHIKESFQPRRKIKFGRAGFISVCLLLIAIFIANPVLGKYAETRAASAATIGNSYINKTLQDYDFNKLNLDFNNYNDGAAFSQAEIDRNIDGLEETGFEMTDDEVFLYSVVMIDLITLGYSVFPASVIVEGEEVYGIGYTDAEDCYEKDNEENTVFVGTGFTAFLNQRQITDNDLERGITVKPIEDDISESDVIVKYLLTFEETYKDDESGQIYYNHYVVYDKYVKYATYDFAFHIAELSDFNPDRTDYDVLCGKLFSYDYGFVVFDPLLSGRFDLSLLAEGLFRDMTPAQAEFFFKSFIETQNENYLTTELQTQVFISDVNLREFILSQQDELFFGISADQKRELQREAEWLFEQGIYYYLYEDANGEIQVDYTLDADKMKAEPNWSLVAVGAVVLVGGIALCLVCPPAGGAAAAAGGAAVYTAASVITTVVVGGLATGLIAAGTNLAFQGFAGTDWKDINWTSVGINFAVGFVTGALGKLFSVALETGKIVGTTAKVAAWVKYAASALIESFGQYLTVKLAGGSDEEAWKAFGFSLVINLAVGAIELRSDLKMIKQANIAAGLPADTSPQIADEIAEQAPTKQEIKKMRQEAVQETKQKELEILKKQKEYFDLYDKLPPNEYGTEWGSLGNISEKKAMRILERGDWKWSGFDGHHIKSVKLAQIEGDYVSIINPNNVAVGKRWTEHFEIWHSGKWSNTTDFIEVNGKLITSVDRDSFIAEIFKLLGRK